MDTESASVALVLGQTVTTLPKDLYIPPKALEVFLDTFEGPLDLLLYLIRKQNLDILQVPIAEITQQYMQYVELMQTMNFELAAEYLLMAAMLAEIKSRMLLPQKVTQEEEDTDPRAELIRHLQEYERFKKAAEQLDALPRMERDHAILHVAVPKQDKQRQHPDVDLSDLLQALHQVLKKAEMFSHHHVQREALSMREKMTYILQTLKTQTALPFTQLLSYEEGRQGVVVSFLAILELSRQFLLEITQADPYTSIYVKGKNISTEIKHDGNSTS